MRQIDADYVLKALGIFNDREHGDPHFLNGIETAREIVEQTPTIGGWISVKDRLPEEETEYLCWFGDFPMGAFARVCRWNKIRGAFWCYADNAKWAFVTHWMPLPEPPKEDV